LAAMTQDREALVRRYGEVRRLSESLAAPLSAEDAQVRGVA